MSERQVDQHAETASGAAASRPPAHYRYAGFWCRTLASLIDIFWQLLLLLALLFVFFDTAEITSAYQLFARYEPTLDYALTALTEVDNLEVLSSPQAYILQYALPAVLIIIFWKLKQATPGKMLLGIELIDADTGLAPDTGRLIVRCLGYLVSFLPFGLGFLWVAVDERKQGFHDKLANTLVIHTTRT